MHWRENDGCQAHRPQQLCCPQAAKVSTGDRRDMLQNALRSLSGRVSGQLKLKVRDLDTIVRASKGLVHRRYDEVRQNRDALIVQGRR